MSFLLLQKKKHFSCVMFLVGSCVCFHVVVVCEVCKIDDNTFVSSSKSQTSNSFKTLWNVNKWFWSVKDINTSLFVNNLFMRHFLTGIASCLAMWKPKTSLNWSIVYFRPHNQRHWQDTLIWVQTINYLDSIHTLFVLCDIM